MKVASLPVPLLLLLWLGGTESKLADRSRIVKARQDSGQVDRFHDNGRPIEGPSYRSTRYDAERDYELRLQGEEQRKIRATNAQSNKPAVVNAAKYMQQQQEDDKKRPDGDIQMFLRSTTTSYTESEATEDAMAEMEEEREETPEEFARKLSSQFTGCCYSYKSYSAANLCYMYGNDCTSGETKSHDSGDSSCSVNGLSFIGVSFSVNTANGNPYSYQLCDQFPMENIIDRDYEYSMSMDEDGWLVGGGYKAFDYSGKMP
jgi:hypothetical protein